jgi:hypothetical protein
MLNKKRTHLITFKNYFAFFTEYSFKTYHGEKNDPFSGMPVMADLRFDTQIPEAKF